MVGLKTKATDHPAEIELASFLDGSAPAKEKERLEDHIACCEECLAKIVSAYEAVEKFNKKGPAKNKRSQIMKKINLYFILAAVSFALSFIMPRYFLQLLVATVLFGIKWIVDAKSTRMLVMIHEAWKKGGEKEASRILETIEPAHKRRF